MKLLTGSVALSTAMLSVLTTVLLFLALAPNSVAQLGPPEPPTKLPRIPEEYYRDRPLLETTQADPRKSGPQIGPPTTPLLNASDGCAADEGASATDLANAAANTVEGGAKRVVVSDIAKGVGKGVGAIDYLNKAKDLGCAAYKGPAELKKKVQELAEDAVIDYTIAEGCAAVAGVGAPEACPIVAAGLAFGNYAAKTPLGQAMGESVSRYYDKRLPTLEQDFKRGSDEFTARRAAIRKLGEEKYGAAAYILIAKQQDEDARQKQAELEREYYAQQQAQARQQQANNAFDFLGVAAAVGGRLALDAIAGEGAGSAPAYQAAMPNMAFPTPALTQPVRACTDPGPAPQVRLQNYASNEQAIHGAQAQHQLLVDHQLRFAAYQYCLGGGDPATYGKGGGSNGGRIEGSSCGLTDADRRAGRVCTGN